MKRFQKKYREKYKKSEVLTAVIFLFPAVFLWIYWFLIPAVESMRLSFYNYSFVNPEQQKFVGIANYKRLFHDAEFLSALKHTFILAFLVVFLLALLAFVIAVLIDGKIKGKGFFRTVYFMPYIISAVAVSIFFMYFFVKGGIGTRILPYSVQITQHGLRVRNMHYIWSQLYIFGNK